MRSERSGPDRLSAGSRPLRSRPPHPPQAAPASLPALEASCLPLALSLIPPAAVNIVSLRRDCRRLTPWPIPTPQGSTMGQEKTWPKDGAVVTV